MGHGSGRVEFWSSTGQRHRSERTTSESWRSYRRAERVPPDLHGRRTPAPGAAVRAVHDGRGGASLCASAGCVGSNGDRVRLACENPGEPPSDGGGDALLRRDGERTTAAPAGTLGAAPGHLGLRTRTHGGDHGDRGEPKLDVAPKRVPPDPSVVLAYPSSLSGARRAVGSDAVHP